MGSNRNLLDDEDNNDTDNDDIFGGGTGRRRSPGSMTTQKDLEVLASPNHRRQVHQIVTRLSSGGNTTAAATATAESNTQNKFDKNDGIGDGDSNTGDSPSVGGSGRRRSSGSMAAQKELELLASPNHRRHVHQIVTRLSGGGATASSAAAAAAMAVDNNNGIVDGDSNSNNDGSPSVERSERRRSSGSMAAQKELELLASPNHRQHVHQIVTRLSGGLPANAAAVATAMAESSITRASGMTRSESLAGSSSSPMRLTRSSLHIVRNTSIDPESSSSSFSQRVAAAAGPASPSPPHRTPGYLLEPKDVRALIQARAKSNGFQQLVSTYEKKSRSYLAQKDQGDKSGVQKGNPEQLQTKKKWKTKKWKAKSRQQQTLFRQEEEATTTRAPFDKAKSNKDASNAPKLAPQEGTKERRPPIPPTTVSRLHAAATAATTTATTTAAELVFPSALVTIPKARRMDMETFVPPQFQPKTEAQPLQVTVAPTATECHVRIPRITAEVSCGCG